MPVVYVDLIEIITIIFTVALTCLFGGVLIMYLFMPGPARNIFKGKWVKRGKRNFDIHLNDDNVLDVQVGRPKDYGNKIGKRKTLVPRAKSDIINKRAVLAGTGIPAYLSSSRTGLSTSPEFVQLAEEVIGQQVDITPKFPELMKPKECPQCANKNLMYKTETVKEGDELKGWRCSNCKTLYEPVTFLNPHVMASIVEESYDPSLIQGIEQDARAEALKEKPSWFIWLIIGVIPYFFLTLINMLPMFGQ